eukprot:INCI14792.6.p1 GENE.INCI14792.6~~INCI14792.6.p1  ORF type:complete len:305 (+),score=40.89 INCI14792.6:231-1145(+)
MSAAVQTTFPPGPGTNCTDLSFADLSKQLEEDLHTTATATLVSAVISTLGSLYVLLFAALRCRERRQKQRRSGLKQRWSEWCAMHSTTVIVLNVTVSCLCISLLLITESSWTLSNISNRHEWQIQERGTCSFFAFLVQLLQWAVMCWNICISIVYTNVGQRSQKWLFVTVSAAVVWTIAVLMAAVPMSLDAYGVSPVNWCWIRRDETSQQHFEWYFFYAEVLVALVVVFVFLSVNTIKAVRRSKATGFARGNRNFARIMFFPLAFLLSYLGGLVNVFNEQIGVLSVYGHSWFIFFKSQAWCRAR